MNLKYYRNKRVLITGAKGFIGSHLATALKGKTKKLILWNRKKDITNWNVWKNIVGKVDIIFHLAGRVNQRKSVEEPTVDAQVNLMPIVNLIDWCQSKKVFPDIIFAGTDTEEDPNATPYEINKLAVENYLKYYATYTKGRAVTLRLGNVFGPGSKGIVSLMSDKLEKGEVFPLYGGGNYMRDWVWIDDVIYAFLKAGRLIKKLNGNHVFIENSLNCTIKVLAKLAGVKTKSVPFPKDYLLIEKRNYIKEE